MKEHARVGFRLRAVGFIFQQFSLLSALAARENVAVLLIAAGNSRAQALERATEVLSSLGLGPFAESLPNRLSG